MEIAATEAEEQSEVRYMNSSSIETRVVAFSETTGLRICVRSVRAAIVFLSFFVLFFPALSFSSLVIV